MILDYNRSLTHKTIVCDFDDTLSITTTKDWKNAAPNIELIEKLNKLFDIGYQIIILTARGQLSCDGNTELADKKYRKDIEEWLKKHNVKYHKLSFHKYLAAVYIDDKNYLPDDFINLDIRNITIGLSGAVVEKHGNKIYKTHTDSIDAAKWYKMASPFINVPRVHTVVGQTICLEYIEANGENYKIDDINRAIDKFSMYRTYVPFSTYLDKIKTHTNLYPQFKSILKLLKEEEKFFDSNKTFCHGDLSIENLIQTDKGLYFIDPLYNVESYSSYLLDISKMLHSYRKYNRMFEYEVFANYWTRKDGVSMYRLQLLELSQGLRIIKYMTDGEIKTEYIKSLEEQFKNFIKNERI